MVGRLNRHLFSSFRHSFNVYGRFRPDISNSFADSALYAVKQTIWANTRSFLRFLAIESKIYQGELLIDRIPKVLLLTIWNSNRVPFPVFQARFWKMRKQLRLFWAGRHFCHFDKWSSPLIKGPDKKQESLTKGGKCSRDESSRIGGKKGRFSLYFDWLDHRAKAARVNRSNKYKS